MFFWAETFFDQLKQRFGQLGQRSFSPMPTPKVGRKSSCFLVIRNVPKPVDSYKEP
jgi:hypothetical protein